MSEETTRLAETIEWAMNYAVEVDASSTVRAVIAKYVANGGRYIHGFAIPGISADEYAAKNARFAPNGYTVKAFHHGRGKVPSGSCRIGQYKVRTGDPESPIFLCPATNTGNSADERNEL